MNAKTISIALATLFLFACSAETATTGSPSDDDGAKEEKAGSSKTGSSGGAAKTPTSADSNTSAQPADGNAKPVAITAGCDATPPALPEVTSEFVVGTPAPAAKGGDEKGTWIATKVTAYLPKSAAVLVDIDASSAEGKGFVQFDGEHFLTFSDTTTSLSTRVSGKVVTSTQATVAGTYTYSNGQLTIKADCVKSTAEDSNQPKSTGFTRISDTEALFIQTGDSQIGEVTIAMSLKKEQ